MRQVRVALRLAIQQALFGLVVASSFRRAPLGTVDSNVPNSWPNDTASFLRSDSTDWWDVTCQRNTGRMCEAALHPDKTVVDYLGQCDSIDDSEHCSTGQNYPAGYCVCSPGHCADGNGKCQKLKSYVVDGHFEITTQRFGNSKKLYMLANGKVMLGQPSYASQAQWRIVVDPIGIMNLFTIAYPTRLLDSYEHCMRFTETVKCETYIGGSIKPPAREAGWKIDHSGLYGKSQGAFAEMGEFVVLREYRSSKNLYIHHLTHEARLCSPVDDYNCPDDLGALSFSPTVHGHVEIKITYPPRSTMERVFHWIGISTMIFLSIFLCVMNARLDQKITHLDDNILTGPAKFVRSVVTCGICGHRTGR